MKYRGASGRFERSLFHFVFNDESDCALRVSIDVGKGWRENTGSAEVEGGVRCDAATCPPVACVYVDCTLPSRGAQTDDLVGQVKRGGKGVLRGVQQMTTHFLSSFAAGCPGRSNAYIQELCLFASHCSTPGGTYGTADVVHLGTVLN